MRWVHELKDRAPNDIRLTPVAKAATRGIQHYFIELLEDRRRRPRNDLVTHLVQADIDGTPFVDEDITPASEIMGLMMVLFLGGVESTAGLTGTLFKLLAENPDQRDLLQADPTLIPDAVEEALRFVTPLQLTARTTSREVELHGVTIPAGGRVVLLYGAANRDERQFPDPDRFDIRRERGRHLGFGEGVHGCLGAPLARLEARIALEEALPVLGRLRAGRRARASTPRPPNMYVWTAPAVAVRRRRASRTHGAGTPARRGGRAPDRRASRVVDLGVRHRRAGGRRSELVADGVATLSLRPRSTAPAARLGTAGAHVDLILGRRADPAVLAVRRPRRSAATTGSASSATTRAAAAPRTYTTGSSAGDVVRVRGPRNHFLLDPSPRYLFLAGGIGITPILPMVAAAEAAGADWRAALRRPPARSMAFLDELAAYGDRVRCGRRTRPGC